MLYYILYIFVKILYQNNHVVSSKLNRKLQNLGPWSSHYHHSHAMSLKIKAPFHQTPQTNHF